MVAKVDKVNKVDEVRVEELQIEVIDEDKEVVENVDAVIKEPEVIADKVKEVVVEELKSEVESH